MAKTPEEAIVEVEVQGKQNDELLDFNFPMEGVTIKAKTRHEAEEKLKKLSLNN